MNKKIKRFIAIMIVLLQVFSFLGFPVVTQGASLLTPMEISPEVQTLLDENSSLTSPTDSQILQQTRANKKIEGPTVTVVFDPEKNAQAGQKITAKATTAGFTKGNTDLYFTWYVKHSVCDPTDTPSDSERQACDADDDGKITVNDWKVEAARIIARGTFESAGDTYSGTKTNDGEKADGYQAYFGNDTRNGSDPEKAHCYMQDFNTGRIFELQKIRPKFTCPEGSIQQCVGNVTPDLSCTYDNDAFDPLLPEDPISNPRTVTETKKVCQAATNNDSLNDRDNPLCTFKDVEKDIDTYKLTVSCKDPTTIPVCVPITGSLNFGTNKIFTRGSSQSDICSAFGSVQPSQNGTVGNVCPASTDAAIADNIATCTYEKDTSADNDGNLCKHLFAQTDPDSDDTGNGRYTMTEEEMFKTDPKSTKTANNGKVDESNVVGLGIDTFSWEYRPGDQIGVAVEGTFTKETQHNDATRLVMWALPNQQCEKMDDILKDNKGGFYSETQGADNGTDSQVIEKILAADFNLDDCLEDNLLDPMGSSSFDVAITYNPKENIYNDPDGGVFSRGTVVTAAANISGMTVDSNGSAIDPGTLLYSWKIDVPRNAAPVPPINADPWRNINSVITPLNKDVVFQGFGITKLTLPLNIPRNVFPAPEEDEQYIRIRVEAAQPNGTKGIGYAIIKIKQLDKTKDIAVYSVSVTDSGKLNLLNEGSNAELCNDPEGKYTCQVSENEIIGLQASREKLSNFQWTVNGQAVTCSINMSSECRDGNVIFVPIKRPDDGSNTIKVTLVAVDKETSQRYQVDRYFSIVDPSIALLSGDLRVLGPRLYGHYKDERGEPTISDYSETTFEAVGGQLLPVYIQFFPTWKKTSANITWTVNGVTQDYPPNTTDIYIDPQGSSEVFVNADVAYSAGTAAQAAKIRKALNDYWGITPTAVIEETSNAQMWIMVGGGDQLAKADKTFFGATLLAHLPQEVLFLARLMITGFMMLLACGVLFMVMPGRKAEEYIQ